tara:strand:+ start:300 stop:467 length:168 start_codon:yes stop_codon:yes gene_type:complete
MAHACVITLCVWYRLLPPANAFIDAPPSDRSLVTQRLKAQRKLEKLVRAYTRARL